MKGYWALARVSAKSALAYRMSFVLSLFGVLFQFLAMLAVWRVLLENSSTSGFTWPQMRGYLLVAFASGALVGLFADFRMAFRIRNGMVSLDLVKPVRYQTARFAEVLGALWIEIAVVIAVTAVMELTTDFMIWPTGSDLALFLLSMALLVPLKFLVLYLCGMACFWMQNYMGIQWARIAIVNLFSGSLVPLAYFPHWLAATASWSPFAGMASTPGLILVGRASGSHALTLVTVQLCWVIVLWFGAELIWQVSVKQLTVNGG